MASEREVAGIRCGEVLSRLSDYLDGRLPAAQVEQVEAHLRGCDWCASFGESYASTVRALRARLGPAEPLPAEVAERLRKRLERERAG